MDDPLRLIRYLYGEDVEDATFARRLTEDEGLYREYERLRETKERMDRRSARRPDPAVVDDIVETAREAAQESSAPARSTADRPARAPTRPWTRRLQAASGALALMLVIGLGWWQGWGTSGESPAVSSSETVQRTTPTAPEGRNSGARRVPAWDDSDELVRIHRRIEQLQAHSGADSWGTLQPASQTRP